MTAPKRQRSAGTPKPVASAELSAMEIRVALAFRKFKPELKKEWVETMENIAVDQQRQMAEARPVLALRLITGGAR